MPDRDPADPATPLCIPHWRAREDRPARKTSRFLQRVNRGFQLGIAAPACLVCEQAKASADCWLCGWDWLRQHAEHEERGEAEHVGRLAALAELKALRVEVRAFGERSGEQVAAFLAGKGQGRSVALLMAACGLLADEQSERDSPAGRHGNHLRVAWVMAVFADWRSGRRSRPGRKFLAALLGVSERTVTNLWRYWTASPWIAERTEQGRLTTQEEKAATGLTRLRAEFDIAGLHRHRPTQVLPWRDDALDVIAEMAAEHVELLAELNRRIAALERELANPALAATDWPAAVRRAQLRQAVKAARSAAPTGAISSPHPVGLKEDSLRSCSLWGLTFTRPTKINASAKRAWPTGREERAPRPGGIRGDLDGDGPRDDGWNGPRHLERPRTGRATGNDHTHSAPEPDHGIRRHGRDGQDHTGRALTGPPASAAVQPPRAPAWAWDLTEELLALPGMRQLRCSPAFMLAATIGRHLDPKWTALDLSAWIDQHRPGGCDDITSPAAWLAKVLPVAGRAGPPRLTRAAGQAAGWTPAAVDTAGVAAAAAPPTRLTGWAAGQTHTPRAGRSWRNLAEHVATRRQPAEDPEPRPAVTGAIAPVDEDQDHAEVWPEVRQPGSAERQPTV